jgi:23S rRNA (uracil1939-C5)-methyltransferase
MMQEIALSLERITYGGAALAHDPNTTYFIQYGIPGEQVRAAISHTRRNVAFGAVTAVVQAAAERVEPPCRHFGPGRCGGCQWQHIDYAAQLRFKREIVREQFRRIGGIADAPVAETWASEHAYRYRHHATFHVNERGRLSYISTDDRALYPIDVCWLLDPALAALFDDARAVEWHGWDTVRLQVDDHGKRAAALTHGGQEPAALPALPDADLVLVTSASAPPDVRRGTGQLTYHIHGFTYRTTAGNFFQVNRQGAELLMRAVEQALQHIDQHALFRHTVDLYGGVGLFSPLLASRSQHHTLIELSASAVEDARHNLAAWPHITRYVGTAEAGLRTLSGPLDCVVLDPPRAGAAAGVIEQLAQLHPAHIVYVSCDPTTLARDAKLLGTRGYRLRCAQPIDMFPHTYHIECVAHFEAAA